MALYDRLFRRQFSVNLYKSCSFPLGEMSFARDFVHTDRGDPYPVLAGEAEETAGGGKYDCRGTRTRLLGAFLPFATYEAELETLEGSFSFVFRHPELSCAVSLCAGETLSVRFTAGETCSVVDTGRPFKPGLRFSVVPHRQWFDVYLDEDGTPASVAVFQFDAFADSHKESFFRNTVAAVQCDGHVRLTGVRFFMDSGLAQADIRPVCYEDGSVMIEQGRVFLTMTVRLQEEMYQGVFSWVPGTAQFEMTGALFFDPGDGTWNGDVASCLLFDRRKGEWIVWMCAFSHGHVLGRARFSGDPRFGRNVIDVRLCDLLPAGTADTAFGGKPGDEDPALYFDGRWHLAVCRLSSENGKYRYAFFESDDPLDGFVNTGLGAVGAETGGSFVFWENERWFVCGNSFTEKSAYRAYRLDDLPNFHLLRFDYPDGGFRGWGTVIPVVIAGRQKLYHLTFDRHNGSEYPWSYGNLYVFEG